MWAILPKERVYSLCTCPCKSAHNINGVHDLWATHSNVLYIPFKAKNTEEKLSWETHTKTHLTTTQTNKGKKKLFSMKRLRWTNVYATLTEAIVIRNCVRDAKDVTFEIKSPLYFMGRVVGNPHKPKEMIGGRLESWDSDSRMASSKT